MDKQLKTDASWHIAYLTYTEIQRKYNFGEIQGLLKEHFINSQSLHAFIPLTLTFCSKGVDNASRPSCPSQGSVAFADISLFFSLYVSRALYLLKPNLFWKQRLHFCFVAAQT